MLDELFFFIHPSFSTVCAVSSFIKIFSYIGREKMTRDFNRIGSMNFTESQGHLYYSTLH